MFNVITVDIMSAAAVTGAKYCRYRYFMFTVMIVIGVGITVVQVVLDANAAQDSISMQCCRCCCFL